MRLSAIAGALSVALSLSSPVFAACERCTTTSQHKPSSIIPSDQGSINQFGDLFTDRGTRLDLAGDGFATIGLRFGLNIGGSVFDSLTVSENGAVFFNQAVASRASASAGFVPISSLKDLGVPVIAPFYADLISSQGHDGAPRLGDVVVQYGAADPVPDANGRYSSNDLLSAVRITWYGLVVDSGASTEGALAAGDSLAFAQLLITSEGDGDFNFEFRSGDPDNGPPYVQAGLGSLAGFVLQGGAAEFTGPYDDSSPSYFAFRGGALAGTVPEPETWSMLILGFGAAGSLLRLRRRSLSHGVDVAG